MPSTIALKNSNTGASVPSLSDLTVSGEVAINFVDKAIYTREPGNTVIRLDAGQYTITAGAGLTGTDTVDASPTFALDAADDMNVDHSAITLTAGTGLTGGGTIDGNVTFNFDASYGDGRYLGISAKAADSNLFDNLDSTQFLRSDTADIQTSGGLRFNDNVLLTLGTGADAELFVDGTHAYLDLNAGISNFLIRDGSTTRFTFDDNGDFTATGQVSAYSDRRLKKKIRRIDSALTRLANIGGYTYVRKDDLSGKRQAGVIAQEIRKVLPEAVHEHDYDEGALSVNYNAVLALVIEAVRELGELVYDTAE